MICLAFYKGKNRWLDRAICAVTQSEYSHVEMLSRQPDSPGKPFTEWAVSSSGLDGGVRRKHIRFNPEHWDFIAAPWARKDAFALVLLCKGKKYDFWALLCSQLFNLRREDANRWFCSEICGYGLGLKMPQTYSPGDLKRVVEEHNQTYLLGQASVK